MMRAPVAKAGALEQPQLRSMQATLSHEARNSFCKAQLRSNHCDGVSRYYHYVLCIHDDSHE